MLPTEWGPVVWYNFHTMSYAYNNDKKDEYVKFFKSIPYILPCFTCTEHFKKTLANSPPIKNTQSREDMIKWLNNIHNTVNRRLKKRIVGLAASRKIYHNNQGNLITDHMKMIRFIRIIRKYLSGGISSIILYHGSNVLINYCYFCPCMKCREELTVLADNYDRKKVNLKVFANKVIDVINECRMPTEIIDGKDINLNLRTFEINQKVNKIMTDNGLKVIIKKNGSTPGVKKKIKLDPNSKYLIEAKVISGKGMEPFLWIRDDKGKVMRGGLSMEYETNGNGVVEVGVLMNQPRFNDIYYIKDMKIKKL